MKKFYITILFSFILFDNLSSQNIFDIKNVKTLGLQTVEIFTKDGEMPTCDYMDAPEGSMGSTCINQNKVPCRIIISLSDHILYDSGEYEDKVSGATIKINGNTSSLHDNKPYKIKLQKKADLLNRGESKYEDKNWRLLKDARTLNTIIGLKVNELLGLPWTPAYKPCNVFLNNEYQGCYLLIESVERNSDCRLNVSKKSGYIIERDPYWWSENKYFSTNYFEPYKGYRWTWKYPDEDDVTVEQEKYIQSVINKAEESIIQGNYEKYIDVTSFAKWLLAHDILGTWDSGGSNLYMMKYDDSENSLLQMANLWDFDTIFRMPKENFSRFHDRTYDFYFHDLFNNVNTSFSDVYSKLWNDIKVSLLNNITSFINDYSASSEAAALQSSRELYSKKWNYELKTVKEDAETAVKWFNEHLPLLNIMISQMVSNIPSYKISKPENEFIYNLSGMRNTNIKKGLYIRNGKKYIMK